MGTFPAAKKVDPMDDIVFPQVVIESYSGPDSWVIAGKVSDVTGWKTVALYPVGTTEYDEKFVHMGIRLPDGRVLDINGVYDEDEFIEAYSSGNQLEIFEVPDEPTYFRLTDSLYHTRLVPYPLKKVIRSMFEKYVPSLLYRLKAL